MKQLKVGPFGFETGPRHQDGRYVTIILGPVLLAGDRRGVWGFIGRKPDALIWAD